jgi:predicted RNase H-like nuclease (RuvC/YqgF family)
MNFSSNLIKNLGWVAITVFCSIFIFSVLSYASTRKLERQNEKIEQEFKGFFVEISEIKVMILESEMQRNFIKDEVQESDVNYQMKMNALQERIETLKNKYQDEN